ncbi:MAG: chitosanase [Alphaproteobacteria bacterium]|nr:chitosanase [Alphaproteobacteria bacterium]
MNRFFLHYFLIGLLVVAAALISAIPVAARPLDLWDPDKRIVAMQLVSSAENSSLDWEAQFAYIEDIGDGRGYTGGIIGFTTATGDLLEVVEDYSRRRPKNGLAVYLPALRKVNGTDSHQGLGSGFEQAWEAAALDGEFRAAQMAICDRNYFSPAVKLAKSDGLGILGQFIYYDAAVVHGLGENQGQTLEAIRATAQAQARPPSRGGQEAAFLKAFLDARDPVMASEEAHRDLSRTIAQRKFLAEGKFALQLPLDWVIYGDRYHLPIE